MIDYERLDVRRRANEPLPVPAQLELARWGRYADRRGGDRLFGGVRGADGERFEGERKEVEEVVRELRRRVLENDLAERPKPLVPLDQLDELEAIRGCAIPRS